MMGHLVDFVGYMFFSSLEYFAMYILSLSIFNIHPSSFKREIVKITIISTIASYLFVQLNVYNYIPSFFVAPLTLFIMLKIFIIKKIDPVEKKTLYAIFVSIAGLFAYTLIQFGLVQLLILYDFLNVSDLANSFSSKTYIAQSLSATISSLIAGYLLYFKGGFGFIFKSGNYKLSTIILILLLLIVGFLFQFFRLEKTTSFIFLLVLSALCISSIIAYYLSYKQDSTEYTF